ncbi:curli assembly protein CsgG [bacterium]|nr:curli assembly protein CsgG [bacterium]
MKDAHRHIGIVVAALLLIAATGALGGQSVPAAAPKPGPAAEPEPPPQIHPLAIFPFQERGTGVRGYGQKIADILFAELVSDPDLYLVEREEIQKLLEEQELTLTGMVAPGQAVQVGQLTGAKILVTGSVIEVGKSIYLVAKIIGTETSRVLGASVKNGAAGSPARLAEQLARKVAVIVKTRSDLLVAKPVKKEDLIQKLKDALGDARRPLVHVHVIERHIPGPRAPRAAIDPAVETEVTLLCKEAGFEALDPAQADKARADVSIAGEAFSEFAMRRGNLVSVKARVEIKATDIETGKLLVSDRQTAVTVDITEQLAGKSALQQAAFELGLRILPKVVQEYDKLHPQKKRGNRRKKP